MDLPRLDEGQRLEELVERAEAAREEDERLGRLHEHRLPGVEVAERHADVAVRVQVLLVRQLDVEADGDAARLLGAAVGRFHDARTAAGDNGEAGVDGKSSETPRVLVPGVALRRARRAEDRHARHADRLDGEEALAKLVGDHCDVLLDVRIAALEDPGVFGGHQRRSCGTWVAAMASTRTADRPT